MPRVYDLCARIQNGFRARLQTMAVPETKMNLAITNVLYKEGFLTAVTRGNHLSPDATFTPTSSTNVATRRLWLQLKYKENQPALNAMSVISKPSKTVTYTVNEMKHLASGRRAKLIAPLQPGEIAIMNTNRGVMDLQEAIEKNAPSWHGIITESENILIIGVQEQAYTRTKQLYAYISFPEIDLKSVKHNWMKEPLASLIPVT